MHFKQRVTHAWRIWLFIYFFLFFFYHPEDASATSCVRARACACNPSLTTAGNETKPSSRFVTLSLLGARRGFGEGSVLRVHTYQRNLEEPVWDNTVVWVIRSICTQSWEIQGHKPQSAFTFFWCCRVKSVYAVHVFQLYTARWAL